MCTLDVIIESPIHTSLTSCHMCNTKLVYLTPNSTLFECTETNVAVLLSQLLNTLLNATPFHIFQHPSLNARLTLNAPCILHACNNVAKTPALARSVAKMLNVR